MHHFCDFSRASSSSWVVCLSLADEIVRLSLVFEPACADGKDAAPAGAASSESAAAQASSGSQASAKGMALCFYDTSVPVDPEDADSLLRSHVYGFRADLWLDGSRLDCRSTCLASFCNRPVRDAASGSPFVAPNAELVPSTVAGTPMVTLRSTVSYLAAGTEILVLYRRGREDEDEDEDGKGSGAGSLSSAGSAGGSRASRKRKRN